MVKKMIKFSEEQKRNPHGLMGKLILRRMDKVHYDLASFAFSQITIKPDFNILDLGCGSGLNIKRMNEMTPTGRVDGLDLSILSAKTSKRRNHRAIKKNKTKIYNASILDIAIPNNSKDLITAFCTIRMWDDLDKAILKILAVLKPNGTFLIGDYGRYDVNNMCSFIKSLGFSEVKNVRKDSYNNI